MKDEWIIENLKVQIWNRDEEIYKLKRMLKDKDLFIDKLQADLKLWQEARLV